MSYLLLLSHLTDKKTEAKEVNLYQGHKDIKQKS